MCVILIQGLYTLIYLILCSLVDAVVARMEEQCKPKYHENYYEDMRSRRHTKRVIFHDGDLHNEFLLSFVHSFEENAFQGVWY